MAPGLFSILLNLVYILLIFDLLFCNLYFPIYKPKIPKIFALPFIYLYQISVLQVIVKGLTTSLPRWVQVVDCLCRYSVTCALSPTGLIPWFSKLREILTLLCCITLSSSRENQLKLKRYQGPRCPSPQDPHPLLQNVAA
mgnify:CR=1 FL=1